MKKHYFSFEKKNYMCIIVHSIIIYIPRVVVVLHNMIMPGQWTGTLLVSGDSQLQIEIQQAIILTNHCPNVALGEKDILSNI